MRNVCVVGAGEAGIRFIKYFRTLDRKTPLRLIDTRQHYFRRSSVFDWLGGASSCESIPLQDFAQEYDITFINDRVDKVNFNTRKLFLRNSQAVEFNELVIASGLQSKDLAIKGDFREGLFYLADIEPHRVRDLLSVSSDIIVYVSTILGLQLIRSLATLHKDIKCIADDLDFLGERKERVMDFLKEKSIDVYFDTRIEEVIGESMVKATRLTLPKVLSSQLVFVDSGFLPRRRFFEGQLQQRDIFFTDCQGAYLLGTVNDVSIENEHFFIHACENVTAQAHCLARFLVNGEPISYQPRIVTSQQISDCIQNLLSPSVPSPS